MKTLRFWVEYKDDFVKISLKDGQVLEHRCAERNGKGDRFEWVTYSRTGGKIEQKGFLEEKDVGGIVRGVQVVVAEVTLDELRPSNPIPTWRVKGLETVGF